jgi:hypothetical protein
MKKTLLAATAATSLAVLAVAAPGTAQAGGGCFGCAVGAGILGGLFAGAIIGSAAAAPPAYYAPPPYYGPPAPGPGCYWGRVQPYWDAGAGAWRGRGWVCP